MDFELTEAQQLFQQTVREFCDTKLAPRAREIDTTERIPKELIREMAELGLMGVTIPERYGGPGGDYTMATLAAIEVARADLSMATAVYYLLNTGWSHILAKHGQEAVRAEVLPKVAKGEHFLGISTTEPGGGSDLVAMKTTARKEKGHYLLRGEKAFISGVREAQELGGGHLTLVKTAPELAHRGMTFLYVPINAKGITTTLFHDMGRMGITTGGIAFDDTSIPEDHRLGEENRGFYVAMEGFNAARTLVSAACIGAAEKALAIGTEYIKQRRAFGTPLGKFEAIQFELADLYAQTELAKLMVLKAAWMLDAQAAGKPITSSELTKAVAICKLVAPEVAFEAVKHAMIWYGAAGYTKDTDLEMGLRGVMSYLIGAEGAQNIMRIILGRELLGPEFIPYK